MNEGGPSGWLVGGIGALALAGLAYLFRDRPKLIFVSYDYDNDRRYKNLLAAWNENPKFSFVWEDHSTKKVDSKEAGPIKGAITKKLKEAQILLVIVGEHTAESSWVSWEIEKAKELKLKLVGVKIKKAYTSPAELLNSDASWATTFSEEAIIKAIQED